MDNRYYDNVIAEMKPFFDEHGFVLRDDGNFHGESAVYSVAYDDARQMYTLNCAEISDGAVGEFSELSAWLFDDSQNAKDAVSVGIDFVETMRDRMGIRATRRANVQVDLPTAEKTGSANIPGFTKKVLDVFPQFKEPYKDHVAKYGNFLYLNFFGETLVPQIREILTENNKKTVKKLFELLEDGYVKGDRDTVNAIVAVLAAAVYGNADLIANAQNMLEGDAHFRNSLNAFLPILAKKKKLLSTLVQPV